MADRRAFAALRPREPWRRALPVDFREGLFVLALPRGGRRRFDEREDLFDRRAVKAPLATGFVF